MKERAEAEGKDLVVILAAQRVEEDNPLGFLSQTLAGDYSGGYPLEYLNARVGRLGGHGRHEGQDLEIEE
eukprot:2741766-Ditylum_brightwellii.AAC.1